MGVCTPQGSLIAGSFCASSALEPPRCVRARYLAASTHTEGAQVPTWPQDPLWAPLARTEQGQRGVLGHGIRVPRVTAPEQRHPEMSPVGQGSVALGDRGHTVPQNRMAWHSAARHHSSPPAWLGLAWHCRARHGSGLQDGLAQARHCTAPSLSTALLSTAQLCMAWHRSSHGTAQLRTALHGTALHGTALHSSALLGTAQHGLALRGMAQHPGRAHAACTAPMAPLGLALLTPALHGPALYEAPCLGSSLSSSALRGTAQLGMARPGAAQSSAAWAGTAQFHPARLGTGQHCWAQPGSARLSLALVQLCTGLLALAKLVQPLQDMAWLGLARLGLAWSSTAWHALACPGLAPHTMRCLDPVRANPARLGLAWHCTKRTALD